MAPFVRPAGATMLAAAVILSAAPAGVAQGVAVEKQSETRLVVLNDGRVVRGALTPRQGGYDVALPAGRMFIPSDRVRFEAADLQEAWRKLRLTAGPLNPDTHLSLARWCISHGLWNESRRELLDAIHLDPNREDARRLLEYVEQQAADGSETAGAKSVTLMSSAPLPADTAAERYSLGGLSAELAQNFVRDVQPLLSNKCGNASCHGPGRNQFEFIVPRFGSTPSIAEQNLAAVLKQIDVDRPQASPLLAQGMARHAHMTAPAFRGRTGARQMEVLRNWVFAVSGDLRPDVAGSERAAEPEAGAVVAADARIAADDPLTGIETTSASLDVVPPNGRAVGLQERDAAVMQDVRLRTRRDAFDPEEFNRKHHGGNQ